MIGWTIEQLDRIGSADELDIAPARSDESPQPYTTVWVVRVGDEFYVRSYRGRGGRWFRQALERHAGHIRAGGTEHDSTFVEVPEADDVDNDAINDVYRGSTATTAAPTWSR